MEIENPWVLDTKDCMNSRLRHLSRMAALLVIHLLSALPVSAVPDPRPNILIAVADDWSTGHAGAYGCTWVKTPAFDRIARDGILFTRAYTPNAKCSPSRAAMLTGRYPWQLGAAANHDACFPPEIRTYPEVLAEHGYFVGMTTKGWSPGIALDAAGNPRNLTGTPFDARRAAPPTTGILPTDYAANFADFLKEAPAGQPWCFWYGSSEPHRDYEAGSGAAKGGKTIHDIDRVPACWPDNEIVRNDMLDYALEVEHFDRHLGRMLDHLAAKGMLENTLVIVTSDNGMPFPRLKGQTYENSNHIPLAASWPARIKHAGRTEDAYVSLIDLAPTFLSVAGLKHEETGMAPPAGRSLTDIFNASPAGPPRDQIILGRERNDVGRPHDQGYPVRGIIRNQQLYLHNFEPDRWPGGNPQTGYLDCDGSPTKTEVLRSRSTDDKRYWDFCFAKRSTEELYDLTHDPDCVANLATRPEIQESMHGLKARLFAALTAQGDPRMAGKGAAFDTYPYSRDSVRNFHERFMRGERPRAGWVHESDFEPGFPNQK